MRGIIRLAYSFEVILFLEFYCLLDRVTPQSNETDSQASTRFLVETGACFAAALHVCSSIKSGAVVGPAQPGRCGSRRAASARKTIRFVIVRIVNHAAVAARVYLLLFRAPVA